MANEEFKVPDEHARALVDPKAYADGRVHRAHEWMRANNPVGWVEVDGFDPFWAITRYADIRAISRDNRQFPYGDRAAVLTDQASDRLVRKMTGGSPQLARSLVQMDPPDHMKYRMLTQSWFTPKNIRTLDARITAIAEATVQKMIAMDGRCDFVEDIALYYPLQVVMEILGVPPEDFPLMMRLTQENFAPLDPDSTPEGVDLADPEAYGKAQQAFVEGLKRYFGAMTEDRRKNPREDVATIIANAKIDGQPMPLADEIGYYAIVATAGHDTTSSSSAAAMFALATQPDLFRRVKDDLSLIPKLIEEAIRWETPVKTFMRSVSADVDMHGRSMKAGDWLMLCYPSGNRDEDVFDHGDRFDIDRPATDHVAFGYGPHVCLGQHLARREMIILFQQLLPHIAAVEMAGEPDKSQSFFVNGLKHLPIRFRLEEKVH